MVRGAKTTVRSTARAIRVVGIGASAGGLEAFKALLAAIPSHTGMAFVLISHLRHDQKSMLAELLSRVTLMEVTQVNGRSLVEANHVYVIAPNSEIVLEGRYLKAQALGGAVRPPMVIDRFFSSLARERKTAAVGVILSGTGSDGTFGLAEIRREGGATFVQDSASAAYNAMPASAESYADYVLSPRLIGYELDRLGIRHGREKTPRFHPRRQPGDELQQIFDLIKASGGVDFRHYKPAGIQRRLARRMGLRRFESMRGYLNYLRLNKEEATELHEDLLITVTDFFRDPETFNGLRNDIIPKIGADLMPGKRARVWVPGCATGEEAYSVAMCFNEAGVDAQIFATDVSEKSIAKARRGIYPKAIQNHVSPERLRRFFIEEDGEYRVSKAIRYACIFARQDVTRDPPFATLDLIVCRNLLIYLDTPTQKDVLNRFHYALKPDRFLLLGLSESTGAAPELFTRICKAQPVFSKTLISRRIGFALPRVSSWANRVPA